MNQIIIVYQLLPLTLTITLGKFILFKSTQWTKVNSDQTDKDIIRSKSADLKWFK